ncbi:MAG: hypothetical protein L0213_11720, partial [Candidatus Dadabacteria bacterium]|nr:hypothetical protein [Candidatus Dadabacteria bacterium]
EFTIEDDLLFSLLDEYVVNKGYVINGETAHELYERLVKWAEDNKIRDFSRRYKSPKSVAQRLAHIKDGLAQVMAVDIQAARAGRKAYSFSRLPDPPPPATETGEVRSAELDDLEARSSPAELEPGAFDGLEEPDEDDNEPS